MLIGKRNGLAGLGFENSNFVTQESIQLLEEGVVVSPAHCGVAANLPNDFDASYDHRAGCAHEGDSDTFVSSINPLLVHALDLEYKNPTQID